MFLTDEISGEAYPLAEVRFHKPVMTVRELIQYAGRPRTRGAS